MATTGNIAKRRMDALTSIRESTARLGEQLGLAAPHLRHNMRRPEMVELFNLEQIATYLKEAELALSEQSDGAPENEREAIKSALDAAGVTYNPRASTKTLVALLEESEAKNGEL